LIERMLDALFPRPLDQVMGQPDLVLADSEDLIRFKEGDLTSFLLRLDPDQEKLVDWALKGPSLIKGGPGTGKSTVALYRVRAPGACPQPGPDRHAGAVHDVHQCSDTRLAATPEATGRP
jgi:hypothetical protein